MPTDYELPEVGEGIEEAMVLKWLVNEGDEILEDDPVVEVETDRAIIEVPSPVTGTVVGKHVEKGETVGVGEKVVSFDEDEESDEARGDGGVEISGEEDGVGSDAAPNRAFASDSTRALARQLNVDITEITGTGEGGRITQEDVRQTAKKKKEGAGKTDTDGGKPEKTPTGEGSETVPPEKEEGDEELSPEFGQEKAPAVEPETSEKTSMFGEEEGMAPEFGGITEESETGTEAEAEAETETGEGVETEGTGTGGSVETGKPTPEAGEKRTPASEGIEETEEPESASGTEGSTADGKDTENLSPTVDPFTEPEQGSETEDEARTETETEVEGQPSGGVGSGDTDPPAGALSTEDRLRHAAELPLVTHQDSTDADRLVEIRSRINDEVEMDVTYTPLLVKACASALDESRNRVLNSTYGDEGFLVSDEINIGVAVTTKEDGKLEVPVVNNAGERSLIEVARSTAGLVRRAREGDLPESKTEGGSFTVTNIGAVGGEGVVSLVNYPEVAAASFGEIKKRPYVDEGEVVARNTLPFSVTYDQRVAGNGVIARFAKDLKGYLDEPERLLL